MCGRFTLFLDAETLQEEYGLTSIPENYSPRYNVAPTTPVLAITKPDERRAEWMRWGLVPSWAKDPTIGNRMINARAETLMEKPSFRNAFQRRRCLIPASGFYEWKRGEGKKPSTPYFIHLLENKPFAFGGLWELWRSPEGESLLSCTIITCEPNSLLSTIHNRMPVIFTPAQGYAWLSAGDLAEKQAQLAPFPAELMAAYPVSRAVNAPGMDNAAFIQPVA